MRTAEADIHQWMDLVDKDDSIRNYEELMRLMTSMDAPLRRIDDSLKNLEDNLQIS
ncbi:hypothetical protein E8E12_001250 [Didymella heteroderae]|uniref:Uncharacterized protein n=1 Tax=Didymella heteroderae TaxID=1769908 RepID=A0A9P4WGB7_9PLEO|nr:hypothetical protein E8E12_001250 [Didymella heteroderae]